ncbi:DUF6371 domain-containing protein [Sphingomonas sp.]|uniref:DUF6371 domain-containing protein n=1 Tax=Sphingomonas sp. TaxID=28214 RepID=UPI003AFF657F
MAYPFASAPTIAERVALGLGLNRVEGGAIVPIPDKWHPDLIQQTSTPGAKHMLHQLVCEGWAFSRLDFYFDEEGRRIAGALRMDHPEQGKKVLPVRSSRALGMNPFAEIKALEAPRPIYNLHHLAARLDAPVLMVEGEKAAEAGTALFPDHVVTTWLGGAQGVANADLRPLAGRDVTIWPDNDEDGLSAADKLGPLLADVAAASVRVVKMPAYFPRKWDVADAVPDEQRG